MLVTGFLVLHRRMEELESQLARSDHSSPFRQYVNDLSPTEIKVVQDYFARLRGTMAACLREHGISLDIRPTSLRWVLQTGIAFLQVDMDDLGPRRFRGYGALAPSARQELVQVQGELARLVERVAAYLRQRSGQDLPERLAKLEVGSATATLLSALHEIISRWQLVEFRPPLDTIVQRLESPQYEIAVFGRVNSGKSSLLNHIAGSPVLPVGITPVTAVPTRLVRGAPAQAVVRFAEMEPRQIDVSDLPLYASERGNPGNQRHVTSIEVRLPAPRLREGVVLVDTPGIGSLATRGSAETLAYLPRCDLGVVLVDAASTLTEEDLVLLRILAEGGIAARVLLSKADLLSPADREQTLNYIRDHVRHELAADLPVHAVTTVGSEAALLDHWFKREIEPLFDRQRNLTETSLTRKTFRLRESIRAVLETMLAKRQGEPRTGKEAGDPDTARRLMDEADAAIAHAERRCREWSDHNAALVAAILGDAARRLVQQAGTPAGHVRDALPGAVQGFLGQAAQTAQMAVQGLQATLQRVLESLQQATPLAATDVEPIRSFTRRGLPNIEPPPVPATVRVSPPFWSRFLPQTAVRTTQQRLRQQCEDIVAEHVQLHHAHVRAWLKDSVRELTERYQSQAEVLREQLRRLARPAAAGNAGAEADELRRDLERLEAAWPSDAPA